MLLKKAEFAAWEEGSPVRPRALHRFTFRKGSEGDKAYKTYFGTPPFVGAEFIKRQTSLGFVCKPGLVVSFHSEPIQRFSEAMERAAKSPDLTTIELQFNGNMAARHVDFAIDRSLTIQAAEIDSICETIADVLTRPLYRLTLSSIRATGLHLAKHRGSLARQSVSAALNLDPAPRFKNSDATA